MKLLPPKHQETATLAQVRDLLATLPMLAMMVPPEIAEKVLPEVEGAAASLEAGSVIDMFTIDGQPYFRLVVTE